MAKNTAVNKQKVMEETPWGSANKLRGILENSEYKSIVLGLIFMKFAKDKFEQRGIEIIAEDIERLADSVEFYTMKNVFFLTEESRWRYIIKTAKKNNIALIIDTAWHTKEMNNTLIKGTLPDSYFSRLNVDVSKLAALLDTISNISTLKGKQHNVVGRVYTYFLRKFVITEGKGEFYTTKSNVNLITEMIEPYKGKIYDPSCGSGGMFVQSMAFK